MTGAVAALVASAGLRITGFSTTVSHTGAGSASAQYTLKADGDIFTLAGVSSNDIGDWIAPKAAAGINYDVRATVTSGALSSGSTAWQSMNADRSWSVVRGSPGTSNAALTIEIRRASDLVVLGSWTVGLTAIA
jgi:hypothetical protein